MSVVSTRVVLVYGGVSFFSLLRLQMILFQYCYSRLWICEHCNQVVDTKQVEGLLDEAKKTLSSLNEDLYEIQQWIDKYSTLLNSKHWIVLDAKQILAGLLKIQCGSDKGTSMKLLKKKLELYEELVPIIKTLRPGLSKMLGNTTFLVR